MSPRPLEHHHDAFDACVELARAGRYPQAVADLRRGLHRRTLHPQIRGAAAQALTRIARIAQDAGERDHATAALEEAVRIAPRFADVHYRLALLRLAAQRTVEARRSLEEALRINPRYVAARVEVALLDAREGRLGEALETLRRLGADHSPEEPRLFGRGLESLEHADWEEAGSLLKQALRLDQPGVNQVIEEFHALMRRGDRAGAAGRVREAMRQHPGYADLHHLLGIAELEEGHLDDAVSSLARALELHPDYHAARVELARALEALGDLAQAEEQVAWVLQADPGHPRALELAERWQRRARRGQRAGAARARATRDISGTSGSAEPTEEEEAS